MIDSTDFVERARRHGIDLEGESVEVEDVGLDFAVGFAADRSGEQWVLRVPRRPDAWPKAQYEATVLRLVDSAVPVSVPRWVVCDPALIAYRRLPGAPLMTIRKASGGGIDPVWRIEPARFPESLVASLADFVATLHAIAPTGLAKRTTSEIRANLAVRIGEARTSVTIHQGRLARWKQWLDDDAMWPDSTVLTHGELHPLHLLIEGDRDARLVGVLDWTEAEFADPAVDYAVLHTSFGDDVFSRIIGRVETMTGRARSERLGERIALWQSMFGINLLEFARRSGNLGYYAQARDMLASE